MNEANLAKKTEVGVIRNIVFGARPLNEKDRVLALSFSVYTLDKQPVLFTLTNDQILQFLSNYGIIDIRQLENVPVIVTVPTGDGEKTEIIRFF